MRVVAGSARGIRLDSPDSDDIRPTSDRVREAVFNSLFSVGGVEGWTVVDLFAGTGAMGIEALSRGATRCTFVERSRPGRLLIEANLARTALADRAVVRADDAGSWSEPVDLVIADPPYAFEGWSGLLDGLDTSWLVAESDRPVEPGPGWSNVRHRTYGGTVVMLARRNPSPRPGDPG